MTYNYKCGDEIITVWRWSGWLEDFHDHVSVHTKEGCYDRTIREDDGGKFFTWNKHKIYLDDWIRVTMKELKQKIDNNGHVFSHDLSQAIMTDGPENVRFLVPLYVRDFFPVIGFFLTRGDETKDVLCKVSEYEHKVSDNYKITVVPVEADETVESSHSFYTSDMLQLIYGGDIKIIVEED